MLIIDDPTTGKKGHRQIRFKWTGAQHVRVAIVVDGEVAAEASLPKSELAHALRFVQG